MGTGSLVRDRASNSKAHPRCAKAAGQASMRPTVAPTHSVAALWQHLAAAEGSQARTADSANARATARASAEEEASPAALGMSEATHPSQPESGQPASRTDHATPLTYCRQATGGSSGSMTENSTLSLRSTEWTMTRPSERGRAASQRAHSVARAMEQPSWCSVCSPSRWTRPGARIIRCGLAPKRARKAAPARWCPSANMGYVVIRPSPG